VRLYCGVRTTSLVRRYFRMCAFLRAFAIAVMMVAVAMLEYLVAAWTHWHFALLLLAHLAFGPWRFGGLGVRREEWTGARNFGTALDTCFGRSRFMRCIFTGRMDCRKRLEPKMMEVGGGTARRSRRGGNVCSCAESKNNKGCFHARLAISRRI
jgi:hypothetical protein